MTATASMTATGAAVTVVTDPAMAATEMTAAADATTTVGIEDKEDARTTEADVLVIDTVGTKSAVVMTAGTVGTKSEAVMTAVTVGTESAAVMTVVIVMTESAAVMTAVTVGMLSRLIGIKP